ncbi:hypothetical protein FB451DRAFT_108007 [Mycena latifolia]|nr:hypothetical protein FB451DRAFT_108007 [Mycena latifolia]
MLYIAQVLLVVALSGSSWVVEPRTNCTTDLAQGILPFIPRRSVRHAAQTLQPTARVFRDVDSGAVVCRSNRC